MGDGRKWAAEQDEEEAEKRAEERQKKREEEFIKKVSDPCKRAFVAALVARVDILETLWKDLKIESQSMSAAQHGVAHRFGEKLRDLIESFEVPK